MMPSNHLILCRPLLLLPSIFPSIRVFSNEWALCIRWTKYWSFTFTSAKVLCSLGSLRLCCDYVTAQLLPLPHIASYIPPWILILKQLHNNLSVCSSPSESSSQKIWPATEALPCHIFSGHSLSHCSCHYLKKDHLFAHGMSDPSPLEYMLPKGFSSGHVWMWELDCEESWVLQNWRFWTVVLDKTLESPLDCK